MSTIVTRAGKGSPLTHAEVDANFTNLNTDKLETSTAASTYLTQTNAVLVVFIANTTTLTNQVQALSDFGTGGFSWFELTTTNRFNRIRLNCFVATLSASVNTPIIFIQYSADTTTWTTIGSGSGADVISLASTGTKVTNWITLPAGAVGTDIYFRVAMQGGDAAADPIVRGLSVSFEKV
jgi:hypothetical protein